MRFCGVLLFWFTAALAASGATLIVSDSFTDGSRSNTGGNPLELVYYMGQTSSTLTVTNAGAPFGTSNALYFSPAPNSGFGKFLAYFGPVTLANPGDSVTLTFNYRFLVAPTNINAGLRAGLYNSNGTRQTNDASDTGVPGPGDRSDDVGYGFQCNPGLNSISGNSVYSEAAGNDILGGASPSQTSNQGTAGASVNSGTTVHFALFQMALQPNGNLALTSYIDNGLAAYASIAAASVFTNVYDEFGLEEGGTGFSVPLLIDNLNIVTTSSTDFDPLRIAWWQLRTGGSNYSLSDSLVKTQLSSITNTAIGYWNSMDKTGTNTYLWSDLTSTTDSSQISTAYTRLADMALAYATYGSALRSNATLAANIQTGLNWMYTNRYNTSIPATSGEYDNWYDWEIGAPLEIADLSVYMYDALGVAGLSNTLAALDHFVPSPFSGTSGTSTGGNLTDKIHSVAVRGAVMKDASKLTIAANAFSSLFSNVSSGDGFYADGSFIQHTHHPYTGSYGLVAIQDTSLVLPWLVGSPSQYISNLAQTNVITPWRCTDPNYTNVMQWVYGAYQPLLYYGEMMDMTRGRAMSRYSDEAHTAGANAMESLLTLAVSAFPAASDSTNIQSMVKYLAQVDTYRNFTNNCPLQLIAPTEQLMANGSITPRGELTGHWAFAGMDRVVHLRPGWGLGLSISSARVYNYESINNENLHGWFEGDGVTYFYTSNDLAQYSSGFWPTVDPYSLPGTTADTTTLANSAGQSYLSPNYWVGGAMLFSNGVAGLDLNPAGSPLTAKESWFMFDDEVVCLGAGITSSSSGDIQTAALNRKISTSNTNAFSVNNTNMTTTLGWQTNLTNTSYCALAGFGGYYFPGGATLKAVRQARTNTWSQINAGGTTTQVVNNFLTLWFDHGIKPTNASYAYVVLPNYSSSQVSSYASNPEAAILSNTTNLQAVKQLNRNIVAANFWAATNQTVDLITVNTQASVFTQEAAGLLSVAVADPTQTNTAGISVTLNQGANSVSSLDPAITITQLQPTIQFTANTAGALGRSLAATFNLQNSPPSLAPIPNTNINAEVLLSITNTATDPDEPYQTLTFSLFSAPTNAAINPSTGVLTWRPLVAQSGTTNQFVVVVTDNGTPSMSATQTFTVTVNPVSPPVVSQTSFAGQQLSFQVGGPSGFNYSIEASTNLSTWTTLYTTNSPALPFNWTDSAVTNFPRRFYRIQLGP
jgi:hyaluronate lyase